ncbi:MAG: phosphoprotein [Wufeng shrew rhabdovirus 7]|nr:MAG: phosphoprotein [Wufeng shrew rhabdovirus 7]
MNLNPLDFNHFRVVIRKKRETQAHMTSKGVKAVDTPTSKMNSGEAPPVPTGKPVTIAKSKLDTNVREDKAKQVDAVVDSSPITAFFTDVIEHKDSVRPQTANMSHGKEPPSLVRHPFNTSEKITQHNLRKYSDEINLLGTEASKRTNAIERIYSEFLTRARDDIVGGYDSCQSAYLNGAKNGVILQKHVSEAQINEDFLKHKTLFAEELPQKLKTITSYLAAMSNMLPGIQDRVDKISGSMNEAGKFIHNSLLEKLCNEAPVDEYDSLIDFIKLTKNVTIREAIHRNPIPYLESTPHQRYLFLKSVNRK